MEHDTYLVLAIVGGVLLMLQVVLQVFGVFGDMDMDGGGDADVHIDVDGHGGGDHHHDPSGHGNWFFGILSFKALTAFATLFGLTGLALKESLAMPGRVAIAMGAGFAGMLVVAFLMRALVSLQSSGTLNIHNAIGVTGRVYLTVPERSSGMGKVTLERQGRSLEILAMTDGDALASGTPVTVVEVVQGGTVKVVNAQTT